MRAATRFKAGVASLALAVSACGKPSRQAERAAGPTTSAGERAAFPAQPALEGARRLALDAPHGSAAVDGLIAQHQAAAQQNPGNGDTWVGLGRDWMRKARETGDPGFYLNADGAAQVALASDPTDKLALALHAMVLMNDHRFEAARVAAEQAVALAPNDPNGYAPLGDALLELGRVEEAEQAVQKMVDLKPNLPSYVRVANLRWLRGDKEGALAAYRLAISAGGGIVDPEPTAWALVQAALIFWQTGDLDGADAGARAALKGFTAYPPALVLQGRVALARGQATKAAALFETAYRASPLVETAWALADARAAAGDLKGTAAAVAEVEKNGRLTDHRTLALFFATKNRSRPEIDEALRLLEAEEKIRGDIYTDDAYAWALYRAGRRAEAKVAIDRATRLGTKEPRLLYHAGAIQIAMGNVGAGKAMVKAALALNPHFDETAAAEAREIVSAVASGTSVSASLPAKTP